MTSAEIELGRIHFLEETTRFPLCRRDAERSIWNWTLERSAVSCPACRELLRGRQANERVPRPRGTGAFGCTPLATR